MPTFDYSFTVDAPLDAVRRFHSDTSALLRLTPPPTIVQLQSIEPLAEGSVSKFTLWFGFLPLRWTAVPDLLGVLGEGLHHVDEVDNLKLPLLARLDRFLPSEHHHRHGA